jgi:hypothetical protein
MDSTSNAKPPVNNIPPQITVPAKTSVSTPVSTSTPQKKPLRKIPLWHKVVGVVVLIIACIIIYFLNKPISSPTHITIVPTSKPSIQHQITPTIAITPVLTQPFTDTRTWRITTDIPFYSISSLAKGDPTTRKDVTGKVFSPLQDKEYFCRVEQNAESMFIEKQENGTWIRLCDKTIPTMTTKALRCEQYNAQTGNDIATAFYPVDRCQASDAEFSEGYYRIHGRIYTNCTVDAATHTSDGKKCRGLVEVYSPQFVLGK